MPDRRSRDYPVGYGKPPRHSQFKKGQSGNPKGRAKGTRNLPSLIMSVLNERVTITENGTRRKITKLEAMTKQLANKGASGDPKATQLLIRMLQLYEGRVEAPSGNAALSEVDRQVMSLLFDRIRQIRNGGPDDASDPL
jgi:hypothetical protein